jgi:hypothetical protein
VFKTLIDGQNDELAAPAKTAVIEEASEVCQRAGAIAPVPSQNFADAVGHDVSPRVRKSVE